MPPVSNKPPVPNTQPKPQVTTRRPSCAVGESQGANGQCIKPTQAVNKPDANYLPPSKPASKPDQSKPVPARPGTQKPIVPKPSPQRPPPSNNKPIATAPPKKPDATYLPPVTGKPPQSKPPARPPISANKPAVTTKKPYCSVGQIQGPNGQCLKPTQAVNKPDATYLPPVAQPSKPASKPVPARPGTQKPNVPKPSPPRPVPTKRPSCAVGETQGPNGQCIKPTSASNKPDATYLPPVSQPASKPSQAKPTQVKPPQLKPPARPPTSANKPTVTTKKPYCSIGEIQGPNGQCLKPTQSSKPENTYLPPLNSHPLVSSPSKTSSSSTNIKNDYLPPERESNFEAPPYLPPETKTTVRTTPAPKPLGPPKVPRPPINIPNNLPPPQKESVKPVSIFT